MVSSLKKNLKVAIVGSVGLPASYGGWETLVDHLTKSLEGQFDFTVFCSAKKYFEQMETYNGAKLVYLNWDANGVQSIPYDFFSMLKSMRSHDVLLVLGVSGCVLLPIIRLLGSAKIIVNIDGLEWRRAKWSQFAKSFLKFSEMMAVKFSDIVVADNKAISDYVNESYLKNCELIPYGGDHAEAASAKSAQEYSFMNRPFAFKVCRIEPENNLDYILEAFKAYQGHDLVIVGNWRNSKYGISLKEQYSNIDHIHLLDPIYEPEKLNTLRSSCSLYIHGHSAGGTNPSLVEAMSLALPIIAFDCNFNRETTENSAIYFNNSENLIALLKNLDLSSLPTIATKMKEIASRRYTWNIVSTQYSDLFLKVIS